MSGMISSDQSDNSRYIDPLWTDTCQTTKRRGAQKKTIKRGKKRIKIYIYIHIKEGIWKRRKCTKRGKGVKEKWKTPLRSTQYASEMECKNRNCKMCNWKLGWTNAGIASDVSRRLFPLPLPRPSFLRGFLPTLRNGLRLPSPSLSSFRSFQRSRKRISQGNHRLGIQMIRLYDTMQL